MTEKLYYADSHLHEFTAAVTGCEKSGEGFAVTLERTAFFPEGGGQSADTGVIGGARLRRAGREVLQRLNVSVHISQTAEELVECQHIEGVMPGDDGGLHGVRHR